MTLLESSWFLVAFLIIAIVLLIDPKSSMSGSGSNPSLGGFSSPSSEQKFIYQFSAVLITTFFILTTALSKLN
jgi:protein translocase SecG subunit